MDIERRSNISIAPLNAPDFSDKPTALFLPTGSIQDAYQYAAFSDMQRIAIFPRDQSTIISSFSFKQGQMNMPDGFVVYDRENSTPQEIADHIVRYATNAEENVKAIIPGVFGFNDVFVAELADSFPHVSYPSPDVVRRFEDKTQWSHLLRELAIPVPEEIFCESNTDSILDAIDRIPGHAIIKPNNAAGSVGARKIHMDWSEEQKRENIQWHLDEIAEYERRFKTSIEGSLVQELIIRRREVGIHGLINRGEFFGFYTQKRMFGTKEGGHYYDPANPIDEWCQNNLTPHLQRITSELGIKNGFFNGDSLIPKDFYKRPSSQRPDFYLPDASLRLGGNGISAMQQDIFDTNYMKIIKDMSLGEDIREDLRTRTPRRAAGIEVGFPHGGNIVYWHPVEPEQLAQMPGVFHIDINGMYGATSMHPLRHASYLSAAEHPVLGFSGRDIGEVRQRLANGFASFEMVVLGEDNNLYLYHPHQGLVTVRNKNHTPLSNEKTESLLQGLWSGDEILSSEYTLFPVE